MATADELRDQLKVVELEEKLVKAKDNKNGPSAELKAQVREARLRARAARDGLKVTTKDGRLVAE